jgi:sulfoxide reductase catalytic subunit YedY
LNRFKPKAYYQKKDISPYSPGLNGKISSSEEWKIPGGNNLKDHKNKISGLVKNLLELKLAKLKDLGKEQDITMHHCIQRRSGIAERGGILLIFPIYFSI